MSEKYMEIGEFVLGGTCPEKHLNPEQKVVHYRIRSVSVSPKILQLML